MAKSPAAPLVAPFFLFMAILAVEGWFPDRHYEIYPLKTVLVGGALVWFWRRLPSLRPGSPLLSVLIGLVVGALWIGLDPWLVRYDQPLVGCDPFLLYPAAEAWLLLFFRFTGFILVVPVMEELFWRGFLMRWLIRDDFEQVPLGTYRPVSFFVTTACFAGVHGIEWPLAVVAGLIYGAWFVRTKKLGDVMLAHGVTNFSLAVYCLATGDWHFLSVIAPPGH